MFDRIIEFVKEWLVFFRFAVVISCYERAVVLRFGRFHRVLEPGFCFHWPFFIEMIYPHPVVLDTMTLREQSLTTSDGMQVVVTGIISYEVDDVRKLLLEVQGEKNALEDSACGVIGAHVLKSTWAELTLPEFANAVTIAVRRNAKRYGISVAQVQFQDMTKSRSLRIWNSSTSTVNPP